MAGVPIDTSFYPDRRLVIHIASGSVTLEEVFSAYLNQFDQSGMEGPLRVLWDWSDISLKDVPTRNFSELAKRVLAAGKARQEEKLAAVASGALQVGLFNVYGAFEAEAGRPFRIFTSRTEAIAWLESG